jgi:hypothetical protein
MNQVSSIQYSNSAEKHGSFFRARFTLRRFAVVAFALMPMAVAVAAQEPLQFNVPYKCADGTQYIIEKCGPYGKFEICTWREEKNGQVIVTANSERTQMYGRLKPCPVQAAAKPVTPAPTQTAPKPGTPTPTPAPAQAPKPGQPLNPPYLKEFPSVDQVMKDMQGSDPKDTKLKQYGAFRQLRQIVQDSTGDRWLSNQVTPDETRIYGEYDIAFNKLGTELDFPLGGYGTDAKLHEQLYTRYSMSGVRAAVDKANAVFNARHQQRVASDKAAMDAANAPQLSPLGLDDKATNEATAAATRRCLELDGTQLQCVGTGFMTGVKVMFGMDPTKSILGPSGKPGLRLTGFYSNSSGLDLAFTDDSVAIGGCGKLVPDGHGYAVGRIGNQLAIRIDNKPQQILVAMGPDGKLTGPGAVDVTGRIVIGHHTETSYKRYKDTNQIVPGSMVSTEVPDYGPATVRCTIGPLPNAASTSAAGNALLNVLDLLDPTTSEDAKTKEYAKRQTPPGPRLVGTYASAGGLIFEFETDDVVIDCQQAHARQKYSVQNTPAQLVITVQNGSAPVTLAMQQNGSLTGPASVNVFGKLVRDITQTGVVFSPTSASCSAGTLTAK